MGRISKKEELLKQLNIDSLEQIKTDEVIRKFIKLAPNISPDLAKDIIVTVPELAKVFADIVRSLRDVDLSMRETDRLRWQICQTILEKDTLTAEQTMELLKIIIEAEQKGKIDWNKVMAKVLNGVGLLAVLVVGIVFWASYKTKD